MEKTDKPDSKDKSQQISQTNPYKTPSSDLNEKRCGSCGATIKIEAEICPKCGVRQKKPVSKVALLLITFFLGGIGAHKFYLGKHWQGVFMRLPRSATRAGFGDKRTYHYGGKRVDQQTHLGIDLASISNSPVPAANAGKVVYAQRLGIYGRTVVIDHGWGLFSMYAHLNSFEVKEGELVQKGDIIGSTGTSGLAGGDHLHFSVLVQGVFVNPLEWWDPTWIQNNITNKFSSDGAAK